MSQLFNINQFSTGFLFNASGLTFLTDQGFLFRGLLASLRAAGWNFNQRTETIWAHCDLRNMAMDSVDLTLDDGWLDPLQAPKGSKLGMFLRCLLSNQSYDFASESCRPQMFDPTWNMVCCDLRVFGPSSQLWLRNECIPCDNTKGAVVGELCFQINHFLDAEW